MKRSRSFQVVLFTIALAISVNVLLVQSGNVQSESTYLDAIQDTIRFPLKHVVHFDDDIACVLQSFCQ